MSSLNPRTMEIMQCEFNNTEPAACAINVISGYKWCDDNLCPYKWFFNRTVDRTSENDFYTHARALAKVDVMMNCNVALDNDNGCILACIRRHYQEEEIFHLKTCKTDWLYGLRSLSEINKLDSLKDELYKGIPFSSVHQYVDAVHRKCCCFAESKICPVSSNHCGDDTQSSCSSEAVIEMQVVGKCAKYDSALSSCKVVTPEF